MPRKKKETGSEGKELKKAQDLRKEVEKSESLVFELQSKLSSKPFLERVYGIFHTKKLEYISNLIKSNYHVGAACILTDITRSTLTNYIIEDENFSQALQDIEQYQLDTIEMNSRIKLKANDLKAIQTLTTIKKIREEQPKPRAAGQDPEPEKKEKESKSFNIKLSGAGQSMVDSGVDIINPMKK